MERKCSVITCLSTIRSWLVRCSGAVSASTSSNGDYGYSTHHSIIRNGLEVEGENNVVAMEFHFEDSGSHSLMIGTFLAPYTADFGSSRWCVILSNLQAATEATKPSRSRLIATRALATTTVPRRCLISM